MIKHSSLYGSFLLACRLCGCRSINEKQNIVYGNGVLIWIQVNSCRIIRGGGWDNYAKRCLTVNRMGFMPVERDAGVGFRVVEDK